MRTLLYLAAAVVMLLCAAWFAVASQIESRVEAAIADLRSQGWEVEYAELVTAGFPTRFDTSATDLHVASPDGSVVWDVPAFRVWAMSYRPNRVTAVWPKAQSLTVAGQPIDIATQGLRASATAGLSSDLPLNGVTATSGLAAVQAANGWGFGMDGLAATAERAGNAYDLHIEAEGLRPATVNANIGLLRLDAQVMLDAPVGLRSGASPRFQGIDLHEVRLAQGDVSVTGAGTLAPDAEGYLAGTLTLTVQNWRGLLDLLQAAGFLVYDQRPFLENALQELAQGSDRIEVPVTFENGQIAALGLVLMDSPRVL